MDLERTLDTLVEDEGFISHVHKCPRGYWTIGHGILVDKRRGGGISPAESLHIVRGRLRTLLLRLVTYEWFVCLSTARKDAILQMAYNLGMGGLFEFKRMLQALRDKNYPLAADEALDSKWAKQVGSRAERIADLIRQG